jgi:hypothetical protein
VKTRLEFFFVSQNNAENTIDVILSFKIIMMEWEPIRETLATPTLDQHNGEKLLSSPAPPMNLEPPSSTVVVPAANAAKGRRNHIRRRRRNAKKKETSGNLHDADVLLQKGGGGSISTNIVKGTSFYRQQLNQYRLMFRESNESTMEQNEIIQSILESVWAKDGRFLVLDENTRCISIASNQSAFLLVCRDLRRPDRRSPSNSNHHHYRRWHTKLKKNKTNTRTEKS